MNLFCPVTGFKVYTRPEWTNQPVSKTMITSYSIIGDHIIHSMPQGVADLEGTKNSLLLKQEVTRYVANGTGPYVFIQDYIGLKNSTQEARTYFIKKQLQDTRKLSLIMYNLSYLIAIAAKIGARFNFTNRKVYVTKLYSDAIQQAQKVCDEYNLQSAIYLQEQSMFSSHSISSLNPIEVSSNENWNIDTPEFTTKTVLIDHSIMHTVAKGHFTLNHIPMIEQTRQRCRSALPNNTTIDYFVTDVNELKVNSGLVRLKYMQSLTNWYQNFPFKLFVLYGLNPYIRTAVQVVSPFVPCTIKIAQDANHAFNLIHQDQNKHGLFDQNQDTLIASQAHNAHLEQLLSIIGNINWEQEGVDNALNVSEEHPFFTLFQSIKLIKEELDSVFADREKKVLTLQQTLLELQQTQEKLLQQERMAAVGQLSAGIAHDFNNILVSIQVFAELMNRSPDMPEAMQPSLQRILTSSTQASHLVRQLLDFSQKSTPRSILIDLVSFLEETISFLRRATPENIQILFTYEPNTYFIEADPDQIQQTITNLVINAHDSMPTGGKLDVNLSWRETTTGEVTCIKCNQPIVGKWICITVTDTGNGIPTDVLPYIFEPFYTTKDVGEGSGLGLPQVYGIVSQHGGHITVESQAERGTILTVYLVPASTQVLLAEGTEKATLSQGQGETILLVEDDPNVLDASKAVLEYLNYKTTTASNGEDAVKVYQKHEAEIALVLSDMTMPGMSGEQLFHTLKSLNPTVKMVIMSGYPLKREGTKLLEEGVVAWLQKPISFETLSQVIEQALPS